MSTSNLLPEFLSTAHEKFSVMLRAWGTLESWFLHFSWSIELLTYYASKAGVMVQMGF